MGDIPSKAMIIGIDTAVASRVYDWAKSGQLPALARLMERGVRGENCLACYPTTTATNWASLATGAWPGTHGVVDSAVAESTDGQLRAPSLDDLKTETLWKACSRGRRTTLVLQWPSPWSSVRVSGAIPAAAGGTNAPAAVLETVDRYLGQVMADFNAAIAEPWEVCFMNLDLLDGFYRYHSSVAGALDGLELKVYQRIDKAIEEIISTSGDDSLVVVVSSHGAKPRGRSVEIGAILEKAGLLAYLKPSGRDERKIDWSRTKAAPQGAVYVRVNLKGRDHDGIVEPGDEYDAVVQQIIDALHGYTDPAAGLKPINLAFRAEDARILGVYGDGVGDVMYALDPRFGPECGMQLPAGRVEGYDIRALFVMAGPGVKKGVALSRNIWLNDVVPTVCYLAELPIPKESEGCVLYQALEDPNAMADDLERLRADLARLKQIVERPSMMC